MKITLLKPSWDVIQSTFPKRGPGQIRPDRGGRHGDLVADSTRSRCRHVGGGKRNRVTEALTIGLLSTPSSVLVVSLFPRCAHPGSVNPARRGSNAGPDRHLTPTRSNRPSQWDQSPRKPKSITSSGVNERAKRRQIKVISVAFVTDAGSRISPLRRAITIGGREGILSNNQGFFE